MIIQKVVLSVTWVGTVGTLKREGGVFVYLSLK